MHVLYVDDDRVHSLLFTEACRVTGGITVDTAEDGAEALDCAKLTLPDLLVIDLHLPDTDGYALLRRLREYLPALTERPAFLCTADETTELQAQARAAGYRACWQKPMVLQTLLSELKAQAHRPSP